MTPTAAFPRDFLWGAATAAYQIEGAVAEDGRGESIWDRFSHTPGRIAAGDTGDVACDHYHRWREDVALMAALRLRSYRFSIAWPRIQPSGRGRPNARGLDFYARLVDALLAAGIAPMATLYHWDLPQALQDQGGWADRDTVERFADYAGLVAEALGDRVALWVTHNEPWVVAALGHEQGVHAPGLRDLRTSLVVGHHLLLSHGRAAERLRELGVRGPVGIALSLHPTHAATEREEDVLAARLSEAFTNGWYLEPLLRGRYPQQLAARFAERVGEPDWVRPGDLQVIQAPLDFLGVNYYFRRVVRADAAAPLGFREVEPPAGAQRTVMGWEVYPRSLTELLTGLRDAYGPLPLYVTENGAAFEDRVAADGSVHDAERVSYLQRHLDAAAEAIAAGVDLRGYFVWSLLDNFEWAMGYGPRFGITYVDYATQRRIPKQSARWYARVIETGGPPEG
ncbi:MAG TPA: GH1 family beta-glucosidase [Candidatus Limnocylindrales bacterium]|nr:GH1 family beta-glucosidase [Candidatus Limnocylindrales bacterium]